MNLTANVTPAPSLPSKPQKHSPVRDSAFSGESLPPWKKSVGFTWYLSVKSAPSVVCDCLQWTLPKAVALLACFLSSSKSPEKWAQAREGVWIPQWFPQKLVNLWPKRKSLHLGYKWWASKRNKMKESQKAYGRVTGELAIAGYVIHLLLLRQNLEVFL